MEFEEMEFGEIDPKEIDNFKEFGVDDSAEKTEWTEISENNEKEELETIIKIATKRLNNLQESGNITEPEGYKEAGELASIKKKAVDGLNTNNVENIKVEENEDKFVIYPESSDSYNIEIPNDIDDLNNTEEYVDNLNSNVNGKVITTSNTTYKTSNYVFTID